MGKGKLTQNGVHLEPHEYNTVRLFLDLGYDIELIPPSRIKDLHIGDFTMMGAVWEMKAPIGAGKYTVQNTMQHAAHQSQNVIIDLRRCKMPEEKAIKDFEHEFQKSNTIKRMKIITKDLKILDFSK